MRPRPFFDLRRELDLSRKWLDRALCKDMDPMKFFPERQEYRVLRDALAVCGECPVKKECLEYALVRGEKFGVWGGKSERQRRRIRAARKAAA